MMQVVVRNISQAMNMTKEMNVNCKEDWSDDYREIGRQAIGDFLQDRMQESVVDYFSSCPERISDRRNGGHQRPIMQLT